MILKNPTFRESMRLSLILLVVSVRLSFGRRISRSVCENEKSCEEQPCFISENCLSASEKKQVVDFRLSATALGTSKVSTAIAIIVKVFDDVMGGQVEDPSSTGDGRAESITPTTEDSAETTVRTTFASADWTTVTVPATRPTELPGELGSSVPSEVLTPNPTEVAETGIPGPMTAVSTAAEREIAVPSMTSAGRGEASSAGQFSGAEDAEVIYKATIAISEPSHSTRRAIGAEKGSQPNAEKPRSTISKTVSHGGGAEAVTGIDTQHASGSTEPSVSESSTMTTTSSFTDLNVAGTESTTVEESSKLKLFFIVNTQPARAKKDDKKQLEQQTILRIVVFREEPNFRLSVIEREQLPLSQMNQKLQTETAKQIPGASLEIVVESDADTPEGQDIKKGDFPLLVAAGVCISIILLLFVGTIAFRVRRRRPATRYSRRTNPDAYEMSTPQRDPEIQRIREHSI